MASSVSIPRAVTPRGITARAGALARPRPVPRLDGTHSAVHSADGTQLHVVTATPTTTPRAAVVLVHGWAMASGFWHHQATDLAAEHVVVGYDQRGHGRSGRPGSSGATLQALGADLAAVLAQVPADLPVVLVGHSMGAMSVIAWASEHSDQRVVGAVLCNTGVHGLVEASATTFGRAEIRIQPVLRTILTSRAPVAALPPATMHAAVAWAAHGPAADRRAVATTTAMLQATRPGVRAAFGRRLHDLDLREAAATLDVPTRVVAGSHDRMTPVVLANALVDLLPRASLDVVGRAGHQAPLERPDEIGRILRAHVDDVVGGRGRSAA
jgi:pimeloyl-ACP methyl ester carboxylesterase